MKKKVLSIILAAAAVLLLADWLYDRNPLAGLSSALILAYLTGLLYLAVNALTWILGLPYFFYSLAVSLPVLSTLHAVIMPVLAKIILPLLLPIQLLLYKIGPLKWIADRIRRVKSVKMVHCANCRREIPADGVVCPYCRIKTNWKRKNVLHKKRGS